MYHHYPPSNNVNSQVHLSIGVSFVLCVLEIISEIYSIIDYNYLQLRPPQENSTEWNHPPHLISRLSRLHQFVRIIEESRLGRSLRGATQEVIESNTFPHKYKRIRRTSDTDDDGEKCTICLSMFEIENDVR